MNGYTMFALSFIILNLFTASLYGPGPILVVTCTALLAFSAGVDYAHSGE